MAGAGGTARVDGWIIKDRVDIEAKIPDLGADSVHVRVTDDVAETGTTTLRRRARKGVVMSHSDQL